MRRKSTASNATSSSTARACWPPHWSHQLTCRTGQPCPRSCAGPNGSPTITHLWLDKGYTGTTVVEAATNAGVSIDIVSGPKPAGGFHVQPRRWVVERTNGWINHCRRIDRHYEISLVSHEGFLILSQIALLLRRLDRSQLFDTL